MTMQSSETTKKTDASSPRYGAGLQKIVVSVGVGKMRGANAAQFDEKTLPAIIAECAKIVGQRPSVTKAKKSIAGFKVRQGDVVGIRATLRGVRMRDFLARLVNAALPRIRDFRGIALSSVDAHGALSVGIREHIVFPETNPETADVVFGVEVTLVPATRNREKALDFYHSIGLPLARSEDEKKKGPRRRGAE
ncbi:MAG: 50S ribosomal protein L5 [Candidatus Colwellbacteria bacterium]|nr:50S ribosomal protein L5 [Candidatus Colwellbacteria bacterium]